MSSPLNVDDQKDKKDPGTIPEQNTGATATATAATATAATVTTEPSTQMPNDLPDHEIEDNAEIRSFAQHFGIQRTPHQTRTETGQIIDPVKLFGGSDSGIDLYESDDLINPLVKCSDEPEKDKKVEPPEEEEKKSKKMKMSEESSNK